jgi:hypothetical protein
MLPNPLQSNNIPERRLFAAAGCKLLGDNNLENVSKGVDSVTARCYIGVSGKATRRSRTLCWRMKMRPFDDFDTIQSDEVTSDYGDLTPEEREELHAWFDELREMWDKEDGLLPVF